MPSKLHKVQKHVNKKKGGKVNALHENSRDAKRLRSAGARDEKVSRVTKAREKANVPWLNRIAFFQEELQGDPQTFDLQDIKALVNDFLGRHDEELAQLKAERRSGRPPSNRQVLLEQQINLEAQEYESGFWLPDLQNEETVGRLGSWKGDWTGLANLRFVRVAKDGAAKESQFPPRGAS